MPQISWSLNLQVQGGPKIATSNNLNNVEAYDTIEVVIPDDNIAVEVDVQPGAATQVLLLLISSDRYGPSLTYKAMNNTGDLSGIIRLDAQHLFLGEGAIGLLQKAPNKLVFTNDLDGPAAIRILVGRKV